ncbi:hypothetical protein SK128_000087 [Halocaridina rubra]|uniref:Uncharacterized protein n=1 Tax=Halocaridina rubra TaxID=373956 RepID=A0AAN9AEJ1_HALRR
MNLSRDKTLYSSRSPCSVIAFRHLSLPFTADFLRNIHLAALHRLALSETQGVVKK